MLLTLACPCVCCCTPVQAAVRRLSTAAAEQGGGCLPQPSVGRLNHVAIAVPNLEQAANKYRDVLGVKVRSRGRSIHQQQATPLTVERREAQQLPLCAYVLPAFCPCPGLCDYS